MSAATSRPLHPSVLDLTETELIAHITGQLPPKPEWLVVGIGDDAAVVEPVRNRLEVFSVDALIDGVHFDRAFTPPAAIGHRALAVNLSDLAAMGASPRLALLSMALPVTLSVADFDEIARGIVALAVRDRVAVVGGNLTRTPGPLAIDITVVGSVKRRQALTRGGARPGDELYVTGSIGAAAAGLQMAKAGDQLSTADETVEQNCLRRYFYPDARVRMGALLGRNRAASACMDLSDGLADAVQQMAQASGVGALIDAAALPIHTGARAWFEQRGLDPVEHAVTGGDDYELLIAVRPRTRNRLAAAARHGDAPLTRIGSCTTDRAVLLRQDGTDRPLPRGYSHFR
jgi:thiamine-monophosphate kinase